MGLGKLIGWLRGTRQTAAIPDALWDETLAALPFIDALDEDEKSRLRALCQDFLAQKEFTSAGGLELTDAMCVSIAAQGCLPILNLGLASYRDWVGIVVYPDEFVIPRSVEDEFGVVHEYDDVASGEAWAGGPLLVSWRDAQMAGDGYNVVIHEFAHKLDMINGDADGVPPLPASIPRRTWETTLLAAYDDFCERVDAAAEQDGDGSSEAFYEATGLDDYGAESPGEFFAVMSETFFEAPDVLLDAYPELYAQLRVFYRQDPVTRLAAAEPAAS
jgi:Mlc titration factor MtfA (ptsG expression regulator)